MRATLGAAIAMLSMLVPCTTARAQGAQNLHASMNEIRADVNASYIKPSDHDGGGAADLGVTYLRFVTDRLSVGPYFYVNKAFGAPTTFSGLHARVNYHFGRLDSKWIPFADFRFGPGFGEGDNNPFEMQILGGLKMYTGKPGAFFLVGPYYYRAFYDEDKTGYSYLRAIGLAWSIGAIF